MIDISPPIFMALCFGIGVILLAAELFLPTHGLLGVLGSLGILAGVGVGFTINPWLGVGLLAACLAALPLVGSWMVKMWPRTFMGRHLVLQAPVERTASDPVSVGDTGVALSELRPIGMCEIAGQRLEALSEHGIIEPGTHITVVNIVNHRPTVRQA
jgi:membrane-bound serine protease (ClpP class)